MPSGLIASLQLAQGRLQVTWNDMPRQGVEPQRLDAGLIKHNPAQAWIAFGELGCAGEAAVLEVTIILSLSRLAQVHMGGGQICLAEGVGGRQPYQVDAAGRQLADLFANDGGQLLRPSANPPHLDIE